MWHRLSIWCLIGYGSLKFVYDLRNVYKDFRLGLLNFDLELL
jgi:hypothetical protein